MVLHDRLRDDANALANSPQLRHLEPLSFWIGSTNDEAVCRAIGSSRALPALKRVELVQLHGGIDAFEQAAELDARADRLATVLNRSRGRDVATVGGAGGRSGVNGGALSTARSNAVNLALGWLTFGASAVPVIFKAPPISASRPRPRTKTCSGAST